MAGKNGVKTVAQDLMEAMVERGIEHVFANAGTDFAPIIETLATVGGKVKLPEFHTVPHENVAMGMAHGYYKVTGKPAGVMVHVNVGTANTICGLMNASRDDVPIFLAAGRTPITETGYPASRNATIHWGQENYDQGGILREYVKWDYELRANQPVDAPLDRALDLAMSEPRGPVYMVMPREVLAGPAVPRRHPTRTRPLGAIPPSPDEDAIKEAAEIIASAKFPLLITAAAGRHPEAMPLLGEIASKFGVGVCQKTLRDLSLPSDHPMNLGFDNVQCFDEADVIIVLDCDVPWIPQHQQPAKGAKVIHIAADPVYRKYPIWTFDADLYITGSTVPALEMLKKALKKATADSKDKLETRLSNLKHARKEYTAWRDDKIEYAKTKDPMSTSHVAVALNEMMAKDAIIVSELGAGPDILDLTKDRTFVGCGNGGGPGFGLGAAAGAKFACPDREVIVTIGDGSYMFGNPVPYHFVTNSMNLPTLTIVTNNHSWHAVKQSTLGVYPDGNASKANQMEMVPLEPSPHFEKVIEATGGVGEEVRSLEELRPALKRAFKAIRSGTPALLNVHTQGRG